MSLFFAGRLVVTPATVSVVDDSAMFNKNLSVGNHVAIIGSSVAGKPQTAMEFGSPEEARAVLQSGDALKAVQRAFDPSAETGGPDSVIFVRVDPATQSVLSLLNSDTVPCINLTSSDYGQLTSQIKVKVEAASTLGKKLTVQLGSNYFSADNVYRNMFSVQYTGANLSANMTIAGQNVTLQSPTGTTAGSIDLNTYPTVQQLVDRINTIPGFVAAVIDGNNTQNVLNGMDFVSGQDVRSSAYTATAHLQACVDWFNGTGEGFVTATRAAGIGTVPSNIGFTYLAGGSNGSITNNDWASAFTVLQSVDVQWTVPLSTNPSIHAMNDSHCAFMSTVGKKERHGINGTALGATDAQALAAAKALNSDRTAITHLGVYDYDDNGVLKLFSPYIAAAAVAGGFAGSNPGTAMTNKSLKIRGIERVLRNPTDTDALCAGGVLCIESTSKGFKVVKSVSTWQVNTNYNRVELSVSVATDFTARNTREALDVLRGQKGSPILLSRAVNITESTLRLLATPEPSGPGVLVGDAKNPPYKNITAKLDGDVVSVSYQASPVIPANYIAITIFAVPFSGSASA